MTRLFKKIARVTAHRAKIIDSPTLFDIIRFAQGDTVEITDLRIKFKTESAHKKTPNSCDIEISNLAASSRADLETKPLQVTLEAGYDGESRLLFVGDLRFGMSMEDGPTWKTLLQIGDGDRTYFNSRCNKSYGPGTPIGTILRDAAKSMGLVVPKTVGDDVLKSEFATGSAAFGAARDQLTRLLAPYGYHWSIQAGKLVVLRDDQSSMTEGQAIPMGEDYGMIGTPECGSPPKSGKPPHVHVKMLLNPEMVPGVLLKLQSRAKNGLYRVEHVVHEGDTHGDSWTTDCEIVPWAPSGTDASIDVIEKLAKIEQAQHDQVDNAERTDD